MSQPHIINKKVFDVVYYSERRAHELQNRLSNFSNNDLTRAIDKILTEFSEGDLTIKLDKVVLDIGVVSEENLENELLEKVKEELYKVLKERIEKLSFSDKNLKDSIVSSKSKEIELLEWFLINGTLPWWFKNKGSFNIQKTISNLMATNADEVASLLKKNQRNLNIIKRVVLNFNEDLIYQLIQKLSPVEAQLLISTGKSVIEIQQKKQLIKTDRQTFRNKTWEFILIYITNERGSVFNTHSFVYSLLTQLAHFFNVDFRLFISQFKEAIFSVRNQIRIPNSLNEIIESIYNTEESKEQKRKESNSIVKVNSKEDKAWLMQVLKLEHKKLSSAEKKRLNLVFETLLKRDQQFIASLLANEKWESLKVILDDTILSAASEIELEKLQKTAKIVQPAIELEYRALCYFLEQGSLSSGYFNINKADLDLAIKNKIKEQSVDFIKFLRKKGTQSIVRKRLVNMLSEDLIEEVIKLLEPSNSAHIIAVSNNLQEVKESNLLQINSNREEFKKLKWEFILEVLLVDRGSQFNLKSFVKLTLTLLAKSFSIDYIQLINYLLIGLKKELSGVIKSDLLVVLKSLQTEEVQIEKRQETKEQKQYAAEIKLNWFQYLVEHLVTPWWGEQHQLKISELQKTLFEITKEHSSDLKEILMKQFIYQKKRQYILSKLDDKGIVQIIRIIEPTAVDSIQAYASVLSELNKRETSNTSQLNFNIQKWDIVIYALIKNRGSYFNMKTFVLSTLHQMAHHFAVDFESLLINLMDVSEKLEGNKEMGFLKVITELKEEFQLRVKQKEVINSSAQLKIEQNWKALNNKFDVELKGFFYLLQPLKEAVNWSFVQNKELTKWLSNNKGHSPKQIIELIQAVGFSASELERIFKQLTLKEQAVWLESLVGSKHLFISYYHSDLALLFASIDNLSSDKTKHLVQAFSLSYLFQKNNGNKHHYFEALFYSIINEWGLNKAEIEEKLARAINDNKHELKSTLPLSFSKLKSSKTVITSNRDELEVEKEIKESPILLEEEELEEDGTC